MRSRYTPAPDDEARCLLSIRIPPQRDEDRPFIVLAPVGADGTKVQGWLVGLPARALDETEQMRPSELHALLSGGRSVAGRLDEILTALAHMRPSDAGSGEGVPESHRLLVAHTRRDANDPPRLKVNPLGLIEYIHDFVLACADVLAFVEPRPTEAILGVGVRGARGSAGDLYLPPFGLGTLGWEFPDEATPPDSPEFAWTTSVSVDPVDVGPIAFVLVQRLYAFFKRTTEEIPYLNAHRTSVNASSFGAW